jgi:hypothetical protein
VVAERGVALVAARGPRPVAQLAGDVHQLLGGGWARAGQPITTLDVEAELRHRTNSTDQGGPVTPAPHLKKVDGSDNERQGSRLSAFYTVCDLPPGSGKPLLSIPLVGTADGHQTALPVPPQTPTKQREVEPNMQPPILTIDLLQDLWDHLARFGAPIVTEASPGLSTEQIVALTEPEGIALPPEAVTWWMWRNGTADGVSHGDGIRGRNVAPGKDLIPLEEALDQRRMMLEVAEWQSASANGMPAGDVYQPLWIPIVRWSGSRVVADCAVVGRRTPLHHVYLGVVDLDQAKLPVAGSIGQMVSTWIDAIDAGLWHLDPRTGSLRSDWDSLPQTWKDSGFM